MLKWIGYQKGVEGLAGIPARDLSDEEVTWYGGEAALIATGLYAKPDVPREKPRPSENKIEGPRENK